MRFCVAIMLMVTLLFCAANASASSFLYFQGIMNDDSQPSSSDDTIYAWDLENNTYISLGIDGYLIDKSSLDSGCYVVLNDGDRLKQITVIYCLGDKIERAYTIPVVDDIIKVYGINGGWLYYSYYDTEGNFGICRKHDNGNIEYYDVDDYIDSFAALEELVFSISDAGAFAFASDIRTGGFEEIFASNKLCIAMPNGETLVIGEVERVPCLAWLNSEELIFMDDQMTLQVCDLESFEKRPFTTEDGSTLQLNRPQTNICISSDGVYLAYQSLDEEMLTKYYADEVWNPIEVLSLLDGSRKTSRDISIRGGQCLQFGE